MQSLNFIIISILSWRFAISPLGRHDLIMMLYVKLKCKDRNVYPQALPVLVQMKYQWAPASNAVSKLIKLNLEEE